MVGSGSIRQAMILAAGLGERMRPLTETQPKPLLSVAGVPVIDRILAHLANGGVETVVVNTFHLADRLEAHLKKRALPGIILSREQERLETGGGVLQAIHHFGEAPFFVINGDALWFDGPVSVLDRLGRIWDDSLMDALLVLHDTARAHGYKGRGDFIAGADGKLTRRPEQGVSPCVFTGIQIIHPRLFGKDVRAGTLGRMFSLNRLYDRAISGGRLYGMIHDGEWLHVGTPDALMQANALVDAFCPATERGDSR